MTGANGELRRIPFARIAVGCLLAAVFIAAYLHSRPAWGAATLILLLVGAIEWARLGGFTWGQTVFYVLSIVGLSASSVTLFAGGSGGGVNLYALGMLFWILLAPVALVGVRFRSEYAHALVGALILVSAWTAIIDLNERNPHLMLFAIVLVALFDSFAMFFGRRFGKKKLAPRISPNKTWEGVGGGFIIAHVAAFGLWVYHGGSFPLVMYSCFTLAMLALALLGDLYESTIKRQAGVSDSGFLLMSHGGVLDRVDGMLPVIPFAALMDRSLEFLY